MPAVAPANTEPLTTAIGWTGTLAAFRMADRDQSLWAYAPATSRWSRLATPASLEGVLVCSHGGRLEIVPIPQLGHGYCAGSYIVVLSGGRGVQALGRYDIEARAWQDVASPPRDPGVNPEMVWTGSELVVMNSDVTWGPNRTFPRSRVYMAYDPAKDTWRDLETPGDWNLYGALWVGDRVLLGVTSQQFRTVTLEPMRVVPPRPEERDAIAAAYWRYWQQRHVGSDVTPEAPNSVDAAVEAGGPDAVALIVAMAEAAPSDDDARTLAVGPLARLVARHWDRVEVEVGAAGRRSPRFRMALCSARGAAPSAAVDRLLAPQPCI